MKKILQILFAFLLFLPNLANASPSPVEFLMSGFTDDAGQPLSGGKVYTYSAGTVSNKTTWSDLAGTTAHNNPIILDSNGKKQVFAEGYYKFVVKDSNDVTLYTFDNLGYGTDIGTKISGGTSTGASNTYSITASPAPLAYVNGQLYTFITHQANTGAATINVNGLGSKNILSRTGQTLVGGEIPNAYLLTVYYNGTSFLIVNATSLPRIVQAYSSSGTSCTGSLAVVSGATVTITVKSGDYVKLNWWVTWSVDNVDTLPSFQIYEGSSAIASTYAIMRSTGDVGNQGNHNTHSGSYILTTPTSGSQTYSLQWVRTAGANVCYSAYRYISAEVISP